MQKKNIYLLGLATLFGFPILGITILGFVESNPWDFPFNWTYPQGLPLQIILGLFVGLFAGLVAWWTINRPSMLPIKFKYGILISQFRLTIWEILFLSAAAGIGEEFLFRGILQEYWGVWITAIVFVAIHGYLDPRNNKMMIYGVIMTIFIGILGYMKIYLGLIAPIVAHFAIDVVLLFKLTNDEALKMSIPKLPFDDLESELEE